MTALTEKFDATHYQCSLAGVVTVATLWVLRD
jgi:hypothetical protein